MNQRWLRVSGAVALGWGCAGSPSEPQKTPSPAGSAALPTLASADASPSAAASAPPVVPPIVEADWQAALGTPSDYVLDGKSKEWSGGPGKGWLAVSRRRVVIAAKLTGAPATVTLRLQLGGAYAPRPRMFLDGVVVDASCAAFDGAPLTACEAAVAKQTQDLAELAKSTVREYVVTHSGVKADGADAPGVRAVLSAELVELEISGAELPAIVAGQVDAVAISLATGSAKGALEQVRLPGAAHVGGDFAGVAEAALHWLSDASDPPHAVGVVFDPKGKEPKLRVLTLSKPAAKRAPSQALSPKDLPLKGKVESTNKLLEVVRYDFLGTLVLAGRSGGLVEGAFGMPAKLTPKVLRSALRGASIDVAWEVGAAIPDSPNLQAWMLAVARFSPDGTVQADHLMADGNFVGAPTRSVAADLSKLSLSGKVMNAAGVVEPAKTQWLYDKKTNDYVEKE